jgi:hypothetical protein
MMMQHDSTPLLSRFADRLPAWLVEPRAALGFRLLSIGSALMQRGNRMAGEPFYGTTGKAFAAGIQQGLDLRDEQDVDEAATMLDQERLAELGAYAEELLREQRA